MLSYAPQISFYLLAALVALAPLPFASNRPVFWLCTALITIISLLLWEISSWKNSRYYRIKLRHIRLPLSCFILLIIWGIIQVFPLPVGNLVSPFWALAYQALDTNNSIGTISLTPYQGLDQLIRFITYGFVFLLALQWGRSSEKASILIHVILYSCFVYCIYGLLMQLTGSDRLLWIEKKFYFDSLVGTFINRNSFATYLGVGIMISGTLFFDRLLYLTKGLSKRDFYRTLLNNFFSRAYIYGLMLPVFFSALMLTHSRAGMVSTLIALGSLFFILTIHKTFKHHRLNLLIAGLSITMIFAWLLSSGGADLFKRFNFSLIEHEMRPEIFRVTIEAIKDNLWIGTGLGSFEQAFNIYRDALYPYRYSAIIDHAHNSYLETLLELGLPAFLLLIAALGWAIVRCFLGLLARRKNLHFQLIALTVSILFAVHATVDFSIEMPALAIIYATILGIGVGQSWSSKDNMGLTKEDGFEFRKGLAALAAIAIISGVSAAILLPSAISLYQTEYLYHGSSRKKHISTDSLNQLYHNQISHTFVSNPELLDKAATNAILLAKRSGIFSEQGKVLIKESNKLTKESLLASPVNSTAWARYAFIDTLESGPNNNAAHALYLSALTGPYNRAAIKMRFTQLPILWDYMSEDTKPFHLYQVAIEFEKWPKETFKLLNNTKGIELLKLAMVDRPQSEEELNKLISKSTR